MPAPKIGSFADKSDPVPESPAVAIEKNLTIDTPEMAALEGPDVYDYLELEVTAPDRDMPQPPPLIRKYCERHELMWRWFSKPMVDRLGMREWTAFSPNGAMRDEIRFSGSANPHGLKVSADNLVVWRDDAFLGVIKRKRYEAKRAMKKKLTDDQTKSIQHPPAELQSAAARVGGRIKDFSVSTEERSFKTEGDDS